MIDVVLPLSYIDPGSGTILLQALVAGVAGLFVFFRYQRRRFMALLGFRRKDEDKGSTDGEQ